MDNVSNHGKAQNGSIRQIPLLEMSEQQFGDGQVSSESAAKPGLNATQLLNSLRRNWLLGAVCGILVSVPVAAAVWSLHKLEYKASALVRISPRQMTLLPDSHDHSGPPNTFKSFKLTQRQLIISSKVLNSALNMEIPESTGASQRTTSRKISDLPLVHKQVDPIGWLQKELQVTFPDDSELMQISLELTDGSTAAQVVNAIVDAYKVEVVDVEGEDRLRRVDNLAKARTVAENAARAKRVELAALAGDLGSGDSSTLNLAQQAAIQHSSLVRTEATKIHVELMRLEGELKFRSPALQAAAENASVENAGFEAGSDAETASLSTAMDVQMKQRLEVDPIGSRLLQNVERFASLINSANDRLTPEKAQTIVEKYQSQLSQAEEKAIKRAQQLRRELDESSPVSGDVSKTDLPREIQILKSHERELLDELKQLDIEGRKFGKSTVEIGMLTTEVEGLDKVVSRVTDELERTKIEQNSNSRISIYSSAEVPTMGQSKRRLPLTAAGGMFGLLAPLVLLMGFDLRRQLVDGSRTVGDMKIPVLGSLPLVPRRMMRRIGNHEDRKASVWRERLAESIATVTSLLLRKLEQDGHRVVMITSATPGEGKTTLAEQLATSLSDSGHRTLLIDFDLRRPMIHKRIGVSMEPGVADVLRGGADLEQVVRQGDSANLGILTAGGTPGSLLQDAANGSLRAMFVQARANYEIVIVDTCPLLPVMDGRLIGQYTDGAILSIIKDVSQVPNITTARSILADYGIPVLGAVVTGDRGDSYFASYERTKREELVGV